CICLPTSFSHCSRVTSCGPATSRRSPPGDPACAAPFPTATEPSYTRTSTLLSSLASTRKVVPRTPATAFSVSTSNFCSPSSTETCAVFGAAPAASTPMRLATPARLIRRPSRSELEIHGIRRQAEHAHGELAQLLRLHLLREFLGRAQHRDVELLRPGCEASLRDVAHAADALRKRRAEVRCGPERGHLAHGHVQVVPGRHVLDEAGGDLLRHVLRERARRLLDGLLPTGEIIELGGILRGFRSGKDIPVVGVHGASGGRRRAGSPAGAEVGHLSARERHRLAE